MDERFDAIIIGSGMGGLAAAAVLARNGVRPLVLEQHFAPGGNAQTFRRKKMFDFDVGLHYIGDCGPWGLYPNLMQEMGIADKVEFVPMDQDGFDTLITPDLTFRVPAGWDRYRKRLQETFPQEAQAIDRYIDFLMMVAGRPPAQAAGREPLKDVLGKPWTQCTLGEAFDAVEASNRLRHVLASECPTYAGPPSKAAIGMHAMVMDHYMRGAYFIRGGARPLVESMVQAIEENGGEVRLRSKVQRIIIEDGKAVGVELAKGERFRAPTILSNADAKRTFLEMVGEEHLSPGFRQRIKEYRMALPLFVIYMAMEVDPSELGLPSTNVSLMPAYDLEEQFEACYAGRFPDRPFVFISIASLKDPEAENLAPRGYTNLQLMTVAPAQPEAWGVSQSPASGGRYRHTPHYVAARREMEARILGTVEEMMPGFIRKVVWQESATPLTQERFTLSSGGTSYGFEHTPDQFMGARVPIQAEVPGLWMAGANTVFGHGIAGAMMSGRAAANAILQQSR
jgi:phytoene dehydrogenase-like protein